MRRAGFWQSPDLVTVSFEATLPVLSLRMGRIQRGFVRRRILPHRLEACGDDGPEDRRIAASDMDSTLCRNNAKHRSR